MTGDPTGPTPEEHPMTKKPEGRTPKPEKDEPERGDPVGSPRHYYAPDLEVVRNADGVVSFVPCKACGNHEMVADLHLPYEPLRYRPRPAPEPIDPDGPYDHAAAEQRVQDMLGRLNEHDEQQRDWSVDQQQVAERSNAARRPFDPAKNQEASADPLDTRHTEHPFLRDGQVTPFEYDTVREGLDELARRAEEQRQAELTEAHRRGYSEGYQDGRLDEWYRWPRVLRWLDKVLRFRGRQKG